jgi:hypothetical protein
MNDPNLVAFNVTSRAAALSQKLLKPALYEFKT